MPGALSILRHEFDAEEGTFLLKLRCEMEWDRVAFTRVTEAMRLCCVEHEGVEVLPRWVAEGFWYLQWFVPNWSGHASFPRLYPDAYYAAANERLLDLNLWFFSGIKPHLGETGFPPL